MKISHKITYVLIFGEKLGQVLAVIGGSDCAVACPMQPPPDCQQPHAIAITVEAADACFHKQQQRRWREKNIKRGDDNGRKGLLSRRQPHCYIVANGSSKYSTTVEINGSRQQRRRTVVRFLASDRWPFPLKTKPLITAVDVVEWRIAKNYTCQFVMLQ